MSIYYILERIAAGLVIFASAAGAQVGSNKSAAISGPNMPTMNVDGFDVSTSISAVGVVYNISEKGVPVATVTRTSMMGGPLKIKFKTADQGTQERLKATVGRLAQGAPVIVELGVDGSAQLASNTPAGNGATPVTGTNGGNGPPEVHFAKLDSKGGEATYGEMKVAFRKTSKDITEFDVTGPGILGQPVNTHIHFAEIHGAGKAGRLALLSLGGSRSKAAQGDGGLSDDLKGSVEVTEYGNKERTQYSAAAKKTGGIKAVTPEIVAATAVGEAAARTNPDFGFNGELFRKLTNQQPAPAR